MFSVESERELTLPNPNADAKTNVGQFTEKGIFITKESAFSSTMGLPVSK